MTTGQTADPIASVGLLAEPTRRRLYEHVSARDAVSRDAAAEALGISRELAAFHLDKLLEGGLLRATYRRLSVRGGPGAGRPAKLYSRATEDLAVALPPRRYEVAAGAFASGLERLASRVGTAAVAEAVAEPARNEGRAAGAAMRRALGRRAGVRRTRSALLAELERYGYEPEVDPGSGTISLANCPYRATATEHRELTCGMNLAWAEGIIEGAGAANVTPHLEFPAGRCCVVFRAEDTQ